MRTPIATFSKNGVLVRSLPHNDVSISVMVSHSFLIDTFLTTIFRSSSVLTDFGYALNYQCSKVLFQGKKGKRRV